jgi:hypothetical protein
VEWMCFDLEFDVAKSNWNMLASNLGSMIFVCFGNLQSCGTWDAKLRCAMNLGV